jgi:O-antigen/teichoic acid export membrane protein
VRAAFQKLGQRRFVRDTLVLQISTFVTGGSYLITSVLTKRYLGMDDLGRWNAARAIFMFAYFLVTAGVVSAAIARYSAAVGRGDRPACVNALASMLKLGLVASVCVIALAFAFAPRFAAYKYDDADVGHFAALLCVSGLFEVVRGLAVVVLQGTRQMRAYSWFDVTSSLLRLGLVYGALESGWGVPGVVWAFLVHMALAGALALSFYRRAQRGDPKLAPPPLREVFAAVPRSSVGHIFGISYLMALNKGINILLPQLGTLLIPTLQVLKDSGQAFKQTGAYSIAYVLQWGVGLMLGGVTQALLPALGFKLGRDVPFEKMGGTLRRVSLIAGCVMVAATLLSVPVMYFVVHSIYGEGAEDAFRYYVLLTCGNLFLGFTCIVDAFYIYSGQLGLSVAINLALGAVAAAGIYFGGVRYGPIGISAAAGFADALPLLHLVYIWVWFRRAKARSAAATLNTPGLPHD